MSDDGAPIIHTESMAPAVSGGRIPALNDEQVTVLRQLAEEKYTQLEIAEQIGASVGTVSRYAKRLGLTIRFGGGAPPVRPAIIPAGTLPVTPLASAPTNGQHAPSNGQHAPEHAPEETPVKRRRGRPPKNTGAGAVPAELDPRQMPLPHTAGLVQPGPVATGAIPYAVAPVLQMEPFEHVFIAPAPDERDLRIRELEIEREHLLARVSRLDALLDRMLSIVETAVDSVKPG